MLRELGQERRLGANGLKSVQQQNRLARSAAQDLDIDAADGHALAVLCHRSPTTSFLTNRRQGSGPPPSFGSKVLPPTSAIARPASLGRSGPPAGSAQQSMS